MEQQPQEMDPQANGDRPPLFRTWKRLYFAVVGYLFLLILLFYAFTRAFQYPS